MKTTKIIIAALLACALLGAVPAMADNNYSLALEATSDGTNAKDKFLQGDDLVLNITATKVSGDDKIAGAAFTLEYPLGILTGPATDADGIADNNNPNGTSITTMFPFSITKGGVTTDTHRQNAVVSGTVGLIYFAGAGIGDNGAAPNQFDDPVLFTVNFKVRNDAPLDLFDIALKPTMLFNQAAGYGTVDGTTEIPEAVTALVGAKEPSGRKDATGDFPVLLTTFSPITAPLAMTDGDSIDDDWERTKFGNLDTATDDTDSDSDGYLDKWEQPGYNNTNPNSQDPAWVLDHYDPSTDSTKYQVVTGDPSDPRAPADDSFSVALEYNVTDDDNALDGFTLVMHYDSTELTLDTWDTVIAADTVVSATDTSTPADATLTVTWTGNSANWPGVALPATLLNANFTSNAGLSEGDTSDITFTATPNAGYAFHSEDITYTVGPVFTLDVDGDGTYNSLTDGILLFRHLAFKHFTYPNTWFEGAVNGNVRDTGPELVAYIQGGIDSGLLDIDGDGTFNSLTDGILLFRYLAFKHFTYPDTWFEGAVNGNVRDTGPELVNYLDSLVPAP